MNEIEIEKKSPCSSKLFITGMDCPDCAAKMEKIIKQIPGVFNAAIIFPAGTVTVYYDPQQVNLDQIIDKIKKLGHDVLEDNQKLQNGSKTTNFCIIGMDCADCADKLEKSLAKVPGIEYINVNFITSKMVVIHSGPVEEIQSTIKKMGYEVREDKQKKQNKNVSFWKSNQYVKPTILSFFMLVLGLVAVKFGLSELVVDGLFLIGIVLGVFLPAKNGIFVLINSKEFDINLLLTIAVIGASVIGSFEEAVAVVFLFSFGNTLQGYTLNKTRNSIQSLMQLTPNEAFIRREDTEMTLPVEEILIGDTLIVRPGERIAMDGKVSTGYSTVNEAPITGESIPIEKQPGNDVYAGTINLHGSLEVEVTKYVKDTMIFRIIDMIEDAQMQRAPSQQFIDKFAKYYTPVVIILAFLVAIIPPIFFGHSFEKWFYQAMAMLLVACPCALVISTPVSIVSAIGNAAKNGVLIKGGMYLEETGSLSVVAFDKTGTLTEGKPQVTDIIATVDISENDLLAIAATIESRSEHPIAEAILKYAKEHGVNISIISAFESTPGKGVKAKVEDKIYQIGNSKFLIEQEIDIKYLEEQLSLLQKEGKTVMMLADERQIIGLIAVADVLRKNSRQAVNKLKQIGIKEIIMLTGDNENTASEIAIKAGVDAFQADLLPEDKVNAIKNLLVKHGKVAMVGDGVNDAPAMAISTVGIAMGVAGTDTALETADIALMADDLTQLTYVIKLSRKALGIIKQNIAFALIVKVLILLLVIPGWLTLWLAVAGDMGSSLLVTLNGMRLLRMKHEE